ncbi:formylglycine-generating enzyme family protein [Sorangium sp. So ce854]|uniref:formylglycine-generating enzyme family protein n=1 Tax=Sorangium sp. So ce854 TaxID=3133322 RepID=UPI003F5FAE37
MSNHPMTYMTWFEAFASCTWDGGRLPTEAELNYTTAGDTEERLYPWGATIDTSKAAYNCLIEPDGEAGCSMKGFIPVGSRSPDGDAWWGMADMAENAGELVLDLSGMGLPNPCNDCAQLESATPNRTVRGGTAWTSNITLRRKRSRQRTRATGTSPSERAARGT